MLGKIAAAHHTLADWDFELGAQYRSLASDYYISAPTSLKFTVLATGYISAILCRIPDTLCLPQGEVRNWVRQNKQGHVPCLFRNQAPLGTSNDENCYLIYLGDNNAYLYRMLNHSLGFVASTPCPTFLDQWTHYRVFWYNGKTPGDIPSLCVDVYLEIAGEWVKQGSTMYHTSNLWKDSAINRCGFRATGHSGWFTWWDDTEIWGPV